VEREKKESGTKQPETKLTNRIDTFQQHLNNLETIEEEHAATKCEKEERKIVICDYRDDLLFSLNAIKATAKRLIEIDNDDSTETVTMIMDRDSATVSSSNCSSQRPAYK